MKKIIILLISGLYTTMIIAQDKNLMAQNYYLQAEDAFNNQNYMSSIEFIKKASNTLGTTNSKILDLKIRSTYQAFKDRLLNKFETKDVIALKIDIDSFFIITQSQVYPKEKYINILNIKDEVEQWTIYDKVSGGTNEDSAIKIIENYIESIGGVASLKKIQTVEIKGTESIAGADLKLITKKLLPNLELTVLSLDNGKDKDLVIGKLLFNGSMGYFLFGEKKLPMEDDEIIQRTIFKGIVEELYYFESGISAELLNAEQIKGINAYKIKITSRGNVVKFRYYDCKTKLLLQSVVIKNENGKETSFITEYSDYRKVGEVYFPFKINYPAEVKLNISEILINADISKSEFK